MFRWIFVIPFTIWLSEDQRTGIVLLFSRVESSEHVRPCFVTCSQVPSRHGNYSFNKALDILEDDKQRNFLDAPHFCVHLIAYQLASLLLHQMRRMQKIIFDNWVTISDSDFWIAENVTLPKKLGVLSSKHAKTEPKQALVWDTWTSLPSKISLIAHYLQKKN